MSKMDYLKLYMLADLVEDYILNLSTEDHKWSETVDRCDEIRKLIKELAPKEAGQAIDIYEEIG